MGVQARQHTDLMLQNKMRNMSTQNKKNIFSLLKCLGVEIPAATTVLRGLGLPKVEMKLKASKKERVIRVLSLWVYICVGRARLYRGIGRIRKRGGLAF